MANRTPQVVLTERDAGGERISVLGPVRQVSPEVGVLGHVQLVYSLVVELLPCELDVGIDDPCRHLGAELTVLFGLPGLHPAAKDRACDHAEKSNKSNEDGRGGARHGADYGAVLRPSATPLVSAHMRASCRSSSSSHPRVAGVPALLRRRSAC